VGTQVEALRARHSGEICGQGLDPGGGFHSPPGKKKRRRRLSPPVEFPKMAEDLLRSRRSMRAGDFLGQSAAVEVIMHILLRSVSR